MGRPLGWARIAGVPATLLALVTFAHAADKDRDDCAGTVSARQIAACTVVLARGVSESQQNRAFAHNNRGNGYNERGAYDRAIADYSEAIRLKPDYAIAYNGRGWAYNNKGLYDRAIPDLNQAIRLNPNLSDAFNNRGVSYKEKGDNDRALADYNRAIRLKPDYAIPYNNRGNVYLDRGEYDRAIADYDKALRLKPNYSLALGNRALAQRRREEAQAAIRARTERETQARVQDVAPGLAPVTQTPQLTSEKRVALVIGNASYAHMPKLPNPRNDAQDLARGLEALGFTVKLGLDASRAEMEDLLVDFAREARRADTAVVFYAGHGLQHNGVNYLAPVDATLADEADLRRFIRVQGVLEELQNARGVRILILDACRDNEAIQQLAANLPKSRSAAFTRGLAQEKAEGVLIAFATQPNRVAQDGEGRNSPFTRALLKYLPTPGLELRTLLTRVRSEVLKETKGEQRPEVSDSLDGEFAFR